MNKENRELNVQQLQLYLQEQRRCILEQFISTERIDHAEAEAAMTLVYKISERPAPEFRWVPNPWLLTKRATENDFRGKPFVMSKMEDKLGYHLRKVLEQSLSCEDFNHFFYTLWDVLPARTVRSLANHIEIERALSRFSIPNSQDQLNTIRQFFLGEREAVLRTTSWSLEVDWATVSLIRLAIAQAARQYFQAKIDRTANYQLDCFFALANSAHAYVCFEELCVMSERPIELHVDSEFRLHKDDGPAIEYKDDLKIFSWHGSRVPKMAIFQEATLQSIDAEFNVEVRRVLIERYGVQSYLLDSGSEIRHHDQYGTLYVKEIPNDENIVMVHVTNSTPEPDGDYRSYFLRVPPSIATAREAVAWTFGMTSDEYEPLAES